VDVDSHRGIKCRDSDAAVNDQERGWAVGEVGELHGTFVPCQVVLGVLFDFGAAGTRPLTNFKSFSLSLQILTSTSAGRSAARKAAKRCLAVAAGMLRRR
jgi:hypothetical protein